MRRPRASHADYSSGSKKPEQEEIKKESLSLSKSAVINNNKQSEIYLEEKKEVLVLS